jgi:multiple sugar transport system substrate-binding protein
MRRMRPCSPVMRPPKRLRSRAGLLPVLISVLAAGACGGLEKRAGSAGLALLLPANERDFWRPIAANFELEHPGAAIDLVEGPTSTDLRENMMTAALLARDDSYDLVYLDVTWTPRFAAAGWLLPLDDVCTSEEVSAFLPAAVEAGRFRGRLYRVPVRTDVGLLYERRDLLDAAGLSPPRTFDDLVRIARALQAPPDRWGFLWQGSQYEGLVCTYLEVLRGYGGSWIDPATLEVGLDRREAIEALAFLCRCRAEGGISPPGVTTYKEDESRRLFEDGRAVFLRNWPYVWRLVQREGSAVAGRVAARPVVTVSGEPGQGTLGGWGLGISRFSRHVELARAFVRHVTTLESQRALCGPTGFAPARRDAYRDPELLAVNPFLAELAPILERAAPRPGIPQYAQASDILQRHLSAALTGRRSPAEELDDAARETRLLLKDAAPAVEGR